MSKLRRYHWSAMAIAVWQVQHRVAAHRRLTSWTLEIELHRFHCLCPPKHIVFPGTNSSRIQFQYEAYYCVRCSLGQIPRIDSVAPSAVLLGTLPYNLPE